MMAGKMLNRDGIIDTIKQEQRFNAWRKREGLTHRPVRGHICGCPARSCGGFFFVMRDRTIPTREECKKLLAAHNKKKKDLKNPKRLHPGAPVVSEKEYQSHLKEMRK